MLEFVVIALEDDPTEPVYAEPGLEDIDEDLSERMLAAVNLAFEGDGKADGTATFGGLRYGWRVLVRAGVGFGAAVTDDVSSGQLTKYLKDLAAAYMDEVDDPREPELEGPDDVVAGVVPPWEEEDE